MRATDGSIGVESNGRLCEGVAGRSLTRNNKKGGGRLVSRTFGRNDRTEYCRWLLNWGAWGCPVVSAGGGPRRLQGPTAIADEATVVAGLQLVVGGGWRLAGGGPWWLSRKKKPGVLKDSPAINCGYRPAYRGWR